MLSEIRLKGRKLLIGAVFLFSLTLAIGIMLVFSLSLMPAVYQTAVLPKIKESSYTPAVSLIVSFVLMVATFMSVTALSTGSDRYMLKKAQNRYACTKDIFYYFSLNEFFRLFVLKLRLFIMRLALFVMLNIPTFLCLFLLFSLVWNKFSFAVTLILSAGALVFLLSAVYFYMRLSASLFLAEYYYITGEYLSFRHLIASSQNAMRGKSGYLFRLKLSFLPWFLSCVFIFPLGYVWAYYRQTLAACAEEIMKLQ